MTDDQFSKAFKDIVPDSPAPDAWADGAKQRRRRRTGTVAGVAGVLAVALAVPIGMQLADRNIVATPAEQPGEGSDPRPAGNGLLGAAACFDDNGEPVQRPTGGPGVETGAVRAWLCGDATDAASFGTVGPLEPLVTGVDQLVDFIVAQPELPADSMCTMEYTLAYRVVLEYPDGSILPVAGELHGCRGVSDGATIRAGGEELYDLARDLWREQRSDADVPVDLFVLPPCPPSQVMLMPSLDEIVGAVACVPGPDEFSYGQVELHPDDVALIVEDIRANAVEGEPDGWEAAFALTGSWGEWLALSRTADATGYSFSDAEGVTWVWTPSPEVAELLAAVLTPDMPPSDPVQPVEPVESTLDPEPAVEPVFEPDGCVGVQDGSLVTSVLDGGVLTDSPAAVWLCGKGIDPAGSVPAGPLEPLEGTAAQSAVDLYNALSAPEPDIACTDDFGPSYVVVHVYADGTRVPVEIQDYGCRAVVTGADQKHGGVEYLAALVDLWTGQREATGFTGERPLPICRAVPSIIPVDPADGFAGGWACANTYDDGTGGEPSEVPLPPELVQTVSEMLADSSYPYDVTSSYVLPTNDALVLTSSQGDPLQLNRLGDGTYQWWDGEAFMGWEPPSAVAVELDALLAS